MITTICVTVAVALAGFLFWVTHHYDEDTDSVTIIKVVSPDVPTSRPFPVSGDTSASSPEPSTRVDAPASSPAKVTNDLQGEPGDNPSFK